MINPVTFIVFLSILVAITILGFQAARWRSGDLDRLQEWGLAGRRFGVITSWFLIGGAFYTANSFIAVPGLVFGKGAQGFYNVAYQTLVYPIAFVALARFWTLARHRGYITAADFVQERFGAPLALLIALTGIIATMPYVALQMYGLQIAVAQVGIPIEPALIIAFLVLSAYTFISGLRAPAIIAIVKGVMMWLLIVIAFFTLSSRLGGFSHIFDVVHQKILQHTTTVHEVLPPAEYTAYPTTVLGSALSFLLYPHTLTVLLSARSGKVIKLNAIFMLAFVVLIAMSGMLGYVALAAGIHPSPVYQTNIALFGLFTTMFPSWLAGFALAALVVAALVPAAIMSIGAANLFTRNIYRIYFRPDCTEREESAVAKLAAFLVKFGALIFILFIPTTFANNFQLFGSLWILQTLPAVFIGLYTRWFHHLALIFGLLGGMILGTWLLFSQNFASVFPLSLFGTTAQIYIGLAALVVNLLLVVVLTLAFRVLGIAETGDATAPEDYETHRGRRSGVPSVAVGGQPVAHL
jgi:SSS family solute:Na+ symporter